MPDFESLEDIQRHYGKLIKNSDDEAEQRQLQLEQREAVADFREAQAQRATLDAHRTTVLASLPAGTPAELLTGNSVEEINARAEQLKTWAESLSAQTGTGEPSPAELYGRPGAGGGTPPAAKPEVVEEIDDFQKRFNMSNRGSRVQTSPGESTAQYTVAEGDRWVRTLGAAHLVDHLARNSSKPTVRNALSQVDPNTLKAKGGGDRITI